MPSGLGASPDRRWPGAGSGEPASPRQPVVWPTRSEAGADGESPDGRGRGTASARPGHCVASSAPLAPRGPEPRRRPTTDDRSTGGRRRRAHGPGSRRAAARRRTAPNPWVGCVIVARDGGVVGEGATEAPGGAHAEIGALAAAGDRARGATAYTTLEPCRHHGRTPPCTDALLDAGRRPGGGRARRSRPAGGRCRDHPAARPRCHRRRRRRRRRARTTWPPTSSTAARARLRRGQDRDEPRRPHRRARRFLALDHRARGPGRRPRAAGRLAGGGGGRRHRVRRSAPAHRPRRGAAARAPAAPGRARRPRPRARPGPLFDAAAPTLVVTTTAASDAAQHAWLAAGAKVLVVPARRRPRRRPAWPSSRRWRASECSRRWSRAAGGWRGPRRRGPRRSPRRVRRPGAARPRRPSRVRRRRAGHPRRRPAARAGRRHPPRPRRPPRLRARRRGARRPDVHRHRRGARHRTGGRSHEGGARLEITAATVLDDATIGASIAVNGCCLTVVELHVPAGGRPTRSPRPSTAPRSAPSRRATRSTSNARCAPPTGSAGTSCRDTSTASAPCATARPCPTARPASRSRRHLGAALRRREGIDHRRRHQPHRAPRRRRRATFAVAVIPHTLAVTTLGAERPATPSTSKSTCWPSTSNAWSSPP